MIIPTEWSCTLHHSSQFLAVPSELFTVLSYCCCVGVWQRRAGVNINMSAAHSATPDVTKGSFPERLTYTHINIYDCSSLPYPLHTHTHTHTPTARYTRLTTIKEGQAHRKQQTLKLHTQPHDRHTHTYSFIVLLRIPPQHAGCVWICVLCLV